MNTEGFVPLLLSKLRFRETAGAASSCQWDDVARVVILTYDWGSGQTQTVLLALPADSVAEFAGGDLDKDVRDVWGDNVGSIEGAARFATIYLTEWVQTNPETPLRLELTATGIQRQR